MNHFSFLQFCCLKIWIKLAVFGISLILLTSCIQSKIETSSQSSLAEVNENLPLDKLTSRSSIPQLQSLMNQGKLSAEELTQFYLKQIKTKNSQLNAVIVTNPEAIKIAQQLDKERAAGKLRGALHGIPILIKDNIETELMPTTAGSLVLKNNHTHRDATVVTKLKAAGAIILGKTNLSEWANMRSERSSSGWSAVGGQTRNPFDVTRSPCGSSSGSGSVVAANLSVAAIGTETNGSITCPSSANGIVGLKPTVGTVSRFGIVPISHTQDTAGPMTKNVVDAAIIMRAILGSDDKDKATQILSNLNMKIDRPDEKFDLKGKRIGILFSRTLNHEGVKNAFDKVKIKLAEHGAVLVEDLVAEPYEGFLQDTYDVLLYEFKTDLNSYLAGLPNDLNRLTLKKIIAFNLRNKNKELNFFQQEVFDKSQAKGPLTDPEYISLLNKIRKQTRDDGIDKLIKENNLDILISATLGPAWKIDRVNGDNFLGSFSTYPAVSGYPHLTIPMGKVHGLPVGLSIAGEYLSDQKVLEFGFSIERILK